MKNLSYDRVKQSFEKEGYTLLSKEYKSGIPLFFVCPNGHEHKIKWGNWQKGQRCGRCKGNIKVTYDQVKQSFEKEGYTLLSKEYINANEYLEFICPNGHEHKMKWRMWQQGNRCHFCRKKEYHDIKQSFEKEGYTLLSKEYKNANQYLEYICPNGHKHKITWTNWYLGHRCGKCHYVTYGQVKRSFAKEGYTLLSKEYINVNQYLEYICPNGHKHKTIWSNWQQGHRCGKCYYTTYGQVKQSFEKEGYTLLSKEYNHKDKLKYICSNGHFHEIEWRHWKAGTRCKFCIGKTISKGEKEVVNYIKSIYEGDIKENDRTLIINPRSGKYLELDIWLPELDKAIEYNSEFTHNRENVKFKDKYKQKWCKENNVDLLVINDNNWIKNKNNIKSSIRSFINVV